MEKITLVCNDEELKERLGENAKKISEDYSFEDYVSFLKTACMTGKFKVNDVNSLKNEISSLKAQNNGLINEVNSSKNEISSLKAQNNGLINEVDSSKNEISSLKAQNKKLKKQNQELLSSTSWKMTSPMRKSKHLIKKIVNE